MRLNSWLLLSIICCLCTGCGLFGEIPAFEGSTVEVECESASDCDAPSNMQATCTEEGACTYACAAGFVDLDGTTESNGCECEQQEEICDGKDNDCDGVHDNLFAGGSVSVGQSHSYTRENDATPVPTRSAPCQSESR